MTINKIQKIVVDFAKKRATLLLVGLVMVALPVVLASNQLSKYDLVAGGDFYQLYQPESHFKRYFYAWINQIGQGSFNTISPSAPFYAVWAGLSKYGLLGFINFPLTVILLLSYLSFFHSVKKLAPEISAPWRMPLSVFYSFNYVTLWMFTYSWGYTHHYLIYIFIPLIMSYYLEILNREKIEFKTLLIFILINTVATVAYNNLGFIVAIFLVEFLLACIYLLTKKRTFVSCIKALIICVGIQVMLIGPFLVSFISVNIENLGRASSTKVLGGNLVVWNLYTSNTFIDASVMKPIHTAFPHIIVYILLPLTLLVTLYGRKNVSIRFLLPQIGVLFLIAFATKVHGPFSHIFEYLFTLPLMALFRSPDKLFIFLPFFYIYLISQLLITKTSKILRLLYVCLILSSWHMFLGNSVTKYITTLDDGYKYAIDIPLEYKNISKMINDSPANTSIVSLPYSVKKSINWSNYPKWGFVGHDILHLLFNRFYISANTFDHPTRETEMSFKDWGTKSTTVEEDLVLIQNFSTEYIIWHKDISSDRLTKGQYLLQKILNLERFGYLKMVESNSYFDLFRMKRENVVPVISSAPTVDTIFFKTNPTEYYIEFRGLKPGDYLLFNQSFDGGWKLYPETRLSECVNKQEYLNGTVTECEDAVAENILKIPVITASLQVQHDMANNYANRWIFSELELEEMVKRGVAIKTVDGAYDLNLKLLYTPQVFLVLNYYLLILTGTASTLALLIMKARTRQATIYPSNDVPAPLSRTFDPVSHCRPAD